MSTTCTRRRSSSHPEARVAAGAKIARASPDEPNDSTPFAVSSSSSGDRAIDLAAFADSEIERRKSRERKLQERKLRGELEAQEAQLRLQEQAEAVEAKRRELKRLELETQDDDDPSRSRSTRGGHTSPEVDLPISTGQHVDHDSPGAEHVNPKSNEEAAEEAQEVEPPSGSQPSTADLLVTPRGKAPKANGGSPLPNPTSPPWATIPSGSHKPTPLYNIVYCNVLYCIVM